MQKNCMIQKQSRIKEVEVVEFHIPTMSKGMQIWALHLQCFQSERRTILIYHIQENCRLSKHNGLLTKIPCPSCKKTMGRRLCRDDSFISGRPVSVHKSTESQIDAYIFLTCPKTWVITQLFRFKQLPDFTAVFNLFDQHIPGKEDIHNLYIVTFSEIWVNYNSNIYDRIVEG